MGTTPTTPSPTTSMTTAVMSTAPALACTTPAHRPVTMGTPVNRLPVVPPLERWGRDDWRLVGIARGRPAAHRRGAHRPTAPRADAPGGDVGTTGGTDRRCGVPGATHPRRERGGPRHRRLALRDRDPVRGGHILRAHAHRHRPA